MSSKIIAKIAKTELPDARVDYDTIGSTVTIIQSGRITAILVRFADKLVAITPADETIDELVGTLTNENVAAFIRRIAA